MTNQQKLLFGSLLLAAFSTQASPSNAHEGDFFVGHSGAGQLVVEFDFSETLPLDFVSGLLNGCALDEPGFASLDIDEPDEDFFTLGLTSSIVLEVVSVSPGFKAHTPGFADILDAPGEQWIIGAPAFDTHLVFHIDSSDPGYDPSATYSMSFKLLDTGATGYSESEVYTLNFQCAARGACCIAGVCEEEFEDLCGDEGGIYHGDGTDCAGVDCSMAVPTVSEWGLAILTLTGLIAGSLLFDRSRHVRRA
jgi:hypothetical protein